MSSVRHKNGRKYSYDKRTKKSILLDEFEKPYYAQVDSDKVKNISITLPESLIKEVDHLRNGGSTSRFIRKCIEYVVYKD